MRGGAALAWGYYIWDEGWFFEKEGMGYGLFGGGGGGF